MMITGLKLFLLSLCVCSGLAMAAPRRPLTEEIVHEIAQDLPLAVAQNRQPLYGWDFIVSNQLPLTKFEIWNQNATQTLVSIFANKQSLQTMNEHSSALYAFFATHYASREFGTAFKKLVRTAGLTGDLETLWRIGGHLKISYNLFAFHPSAKNIFTDALHTAMKLADLRNEAELLQNLATYGEKTLLDNPDILAQLVEIAGGSPNPKYPKVFIELAKIKRLKIYLSKRKKMGAIFETELLKSFASIAELGELETICELKKYGWEWTQAEPLKEAFEKALRTTLHQAAASGRINEFTHVAIYGGLLFSQHEKVMKSFDRYFADAVAVASHHQNFTELNNLRKFFNREKNVTRYTLTHRSVTNITADLEARLAEARRCRALAAQADDY